MFQVVCPLCRGVLQPSVPHWRCRACSRWFPALRGIPDLRVRQDAYLANDEDWDLARRLDADFDRLDFPGLLRRHYERLPGLPEPILRRQLDHILHAGSRVDAWMDRVASDCSDAAAILDLGTGTGSFLEALGRSGIEALGVDIALRWLVLARKRLDEAGLPHVPLICGCAEQLPLGDGSVTHVLAGDVIEHVSDPAATLEEAYRVLRPGGRLWMATPNRFSLAPEPHVGVWGVGFLPRRWMPAYVRWAGGPEFRAIRTMGVLGWRRLLRRSSFGSWRIEVPRLGAEDTEHPSGRRRRLARMHNRVVANVAGQRIALGFGPLFHIECTRTAERAGEPPEPLPQAPGRDKQSDEG